LILANHEQVGDRNQGQHTGSNQGREHPWGGPTRLMRRASGVPGARGALVSATPWAVVGVIDLRTALLTEHGVPHFPSMVAREGGLRGKTTEARTAHAQVR
jgi:hypothetical protein